MKTRKHRAIAVLPNGKKIVLGKFNTHKEAHAFINRVYLGAEH